MVVTFSRSNNARGKFSRKEGLEETEGGGIIQGRIRCRLLTLVLQTRSTPTLSVNVGSCQNIKRFRSPGLSRTSKDVGHVETFGFSVSVNGNIIIRRYGKTNFQGLQAYVEHRGMMERRFSFLRFKFINLWIRNSCFWMYITSVVIVNKFFYFRYCKIFLF